VFGPELRAPGVDLCSAKGSAGAAMKTAEQIVDACLSGGEISPLNVTGTVMRAYAVAPYACYCQFHVDPKEKDPLTRFGEYLRGWGIELEQRYVDSIDSTVRKQTFSYDRAGFEGFVAAALSGQKYIYNPPLFYLKDNLAGKPDLLERDDSVASDFGAYHYRVTEIKFSSGFKKKRHYLLQGMLYNHLLGKIQGYVPPQFTMVDRHNAATTFDYAPLEDELLQSLKDIEDIRSGKDKPDAVHGTCSGAYWSRYCDRQAEAERDISVVPLLKDRRIRSQMVAAGIRIFDHVAALSPDEISQFKWVGERAELISQHARCLVTGKESVISPVAFPVVNGAEVYLDVEDTGTVHPRIPHFVFLIGAAVRKVGAAPVSHSFVIDSQKDIPTKTSEFLALLDSLGDYRVYIWSQKEIVEFNKIFEAYGIANRSVDEFNSRCLDLKELFEGKVYFPVYGNSVKDIAKFLGYKWREEGVDAMEGMALTYEYLEKGDQEALKKVQTYNDDDCLAMITIKDWLVAHASSDSRL
jgi:predicted RecB family nuclease